METIFDYNQIKQIIPHRQPFLLIDKIVEYDEGKRCVGLKQVSVQKTSRTWRYINVGS